MRPPILGWKVMLALLAVVVVGVSLGSVLHSTSTARVLQGRGVDRSPGGWTGYVPQGRHRDRWVLSGAYSPSPWERLQMCSALRRTLSHPIRNPFPPPVRRPSTASLDVPQPPAPL